MSHQSFYPLAGDNSETQPVLFALALDNPQQRNALLDEAMVRLNAATAMSDALVTAQIEPHGARTHAPFAEAIAILSRDAAQLMQIARGVSAR
ncbi:hypothetical protein DFR29_1072 [Tahibacter aquaticus]|uniref:Uncharacterized protein n=1 Tax=Tahibacter aquaticus TaxID=520092 RepID=A0A4R6YW12_9GAMM|nr:hypothetical protein [Tahibacter aquaticus]TDR42998.1 hypothetical protein DFR29_1072 [Tahibacter aquaticus]